MTSITRFVEPTVLPVTKELAKLHCRVTNTAEDTLFTDVLIPAARQEAEQITRRTLCRTTWRLALDGFPCGPHIRLPYPTVQALSAFQYRNLSGVWTALDVALYGTDLDDRRVYLKSGQYWPTDIDLNYEGAVRLDYVAGFANPLTGDDAAQALAIQAAVPGAIKAWLLMRVATLYEYKEQILAGLDIREVPFVNGLLDPYRVFGGLS